MKIGQYYTTERIIAAGTGCSVVPVLLNGGVAFQSMEEIDMRMQAAIKGAPVINRFIFQFLRPGKAEIQLANYRTFDYENVEYEDVISFDVENENCVSRQVWEAFKLLSREEEALFNQVMSSHVEDKYTPCRVSTLKEDGCLYRFACINKNVHSAKCYAIITISVPKSGEPCLVSIEKQ